VSDYGYFWNTSTTYNPIALEDNIPFDDGSTSSSTINYSSTTQEITIDTAGLYDIKFVVAAQNANQVTLFLNNSPVSGGTYGIDTGNSTNYGHVLVSVPADGKIALKNYRTQAASGNIVLRYDPGGSTSVDPVAINASILIEKIG
jgi:hypothetical protein